MNHQPFQFSIRGMLWAMLWIGIGLATIPLFDAAHFLDDDGDNVGPRMLAALWVALAAGVVESLRGRPIAWVSKALVIWVAACVAIVVMAIL
jgi:hypothetical protein